ncbi:MAG: hypothetical protein GF330_13100 [Candidatus Eisenbacteria bacterium]|nr:hypothetical protein [Candidatus Eisenbacteria bacterium]
MTGCGRQTLRRVRRAGLVILVIAVGLAQPDAQTARQEAVQRRCRERSDSLANYRDRLIVSAESLAAQQARAAGRGDRDLEGRLLARGETLADSIRAVSVAYLAQRMRCQQLGGALPLRADFPLPEAGEADPPTLLRQKAGYARDLIDRIDRWLATVGGERDRLAELRLAEEMRRLVEDQSVFDERGALEIGGGDALGILEDHPEAPGLLARLLQEMPGMAAAEEPEAVLAALETWLLERRSALVARASDLEAEALRRERGP